MATEEKKDQGTVEKPGQSSEEYKLPERGYFQGDEMLKFMEQMEAAGKESPKTPPPKIKMKDGKPCPECPDEEPKIEAKPPERKPFKILKVKGKDFPVYSEKEYDDLAQKGGHYTQERQRDAEWEKDLAAREERVERLAPHIERIVEFLDSGGELPGARVPKREEAPAEEEILDPIAAEKVKTLEARLSAIEAENKYLKGKDQVDSFERAQRELTETFNNVAKEYPFEQVLDEDRRNITQEMFSGLVALKMNKDAMRKGREKGFKMKTIEEYFVDGAKDMNYLEKHFRGNSQGEISAESIKAKFPKVAESLGQEAIDAYLKSLEDKETPVIKPTKIEPSMRQPKREIKGIQDAIEQGLADPEVAEGLEELARKFRLEQGG